MSNLPSKPLSVALCTYNGERFLPQQLASIRSQTRLPDEVVICDDASTDNTIELLEAFRREAPFPVHLIRQPGNIGSVKNFEQALRHCTGELIALSDQDDLWLPERLQASEDFLRQHPEAAFVFTDGRLIDEQHRALPQSLWQTFHFDQSLQDRMAARDYSILLRHRFITGATITLRAQLLAHVLPFPASWVHDAWLAAITPFFFEIGMLPWPAIEYRVHSAQQVGAHRTRTSTSAAHWAHIEHVRQQMRDLLAHLEAHPPTQHYELAEANRDRAAAIERRAALPASRFQRAGRVARHLPDYTRHAAGLPSAIKDILFAHRPSP